MAATRGLAEEQVQAHRHAPTPERRERRRGRVGHVMGVGVQALTVKPFR